MLLDFDKFGGGVFAAIHGQTYRGSDVGWVANSVLFSVDSEEVAVDGFREGDSDAQMSRPVDEYDVEADEVTDEDAEEDGAVLAVVVGGEEAFVAEERTFVAELVLVGGVFEGCVHEVEEHGDLLFDGASLELLAEDGIECVFNAVAEIGLRIIVPFSRDGVVVEEVDETFVDRDFGPESAEVLGGKSA